jgi:hypothetical protein
MLAPVGVLLCDLALHHHPPAVTLSGLLYIPLGIPHSETHKRTVYQLVFHLKGLP